MAQRDDAAIQMCGDFIRYGQGSDMVTVAMTDYEDATAYADAVEGAVKKCSFFVLCFDEDDTDSIKHLRNGFEECGLKEIPFRFILMGTKYVSYMSIKDLVENEEYEKLAKLTKRFREAFGKEFNVNKFLEELGKDPDISFFLELKKNNRL